MDIVERLKRVKYTRERNDAPNGFSWDEPCDADDYGAEQRFVNPDGPEAADEIERLRKVNVMQARWLHEAQQEHKKFKDYVRQLLSVESAALKEGE